MAIFTLKKKKRRDHLCLQIQNIDGTKKNIFVDPNVATYSNPQLIYNSAKKKPSGNR